MLFPPLGSPPGDARANRSCVQSPAVCAAIQIIFSEQMPQNGTDDPAVSKFVKITRDSDNRPSAATIQTPRKNRAP
jgi:hypothetical protein